MIANERFILTKNYCFKGNIIYIKIFEKNLNRRHTFKSQNFRFLVGFLDFIKLDLFSDSKKTNFFS